MRSFVARPIQAIGESGAGLGRWAPTQLDNAWGLAVGANEQGVACRAKRTWSLFDRSLANAETPSAADRCHLLQLRMLIRRHCRHTLVAFSSPLPPPACVASSPRSAARRGESASGLDCPTRQVPLARGGAVKVPTVFSTDRCETRARWKRARTARRRLSAAFPLMSVGKATHRRYSSTGVRSRSRMGDSSEQGLREPDDDWKRHFTFTRVPQATSPAASEPAWA